MGQLSQHPGHKAAAADRIRTAREHYETRASRRVNKAPGIARHKGSLQEYINAQYAKNPGMKEEVDALVREMMAEQDSEARRARTFSPSD